MNENIICKGEKHSGFLKIVCIIGLLVAGLFMVIGLKAFPWVFDSYHSGGMGYGFTVCIFLVFFIIGIVTNICYKREELTITDKRVYGITFGGKRVDLPLDSISAVGIGLFKTMTFATSSGRISFAGVVNVDEMHKSISDLLLERQSKPKETTTIKQEIPQSNADELKKFKDLLDSGVITQEEFDAKKKQLLGL